MFLHQHLVCVLCICRCGLDFDPGPFNDRSKWVPTHASVLYKNSMKVLLHSSWQFSDSCTIDFHWHAVSAHKIIDNAQTKFNEYLTISKFRIWNVAMTFKFTLKRFPKVETIIIPLTKKSCFELALIWPNSIACSGWVAASLCSSHWSTITVIR